VQLQPNTTKDIEKVVREWGCVLKKTCLNDSNTLINASMECCRRSSSIKSAFHVFVQYMYKFKLLTEADVIGWHKSNKDVKENEYFVVLVNFTCYIVQSVCQ
jgi:hypothetical protein